MRVYQESNVYTLSVPRDKHRLAVSNSNGFTLVVIKQLRFTGVADRLTFRLARFLTFLHPPRFVDDATEQLLSDGASSPRWPKFAFACRFFIDPGSEEIFSNSSARIRRFNARN